MKTATLQQGLRADCRGLVMSLADATATPIPRFPHYVRQHAQGQALETTMKDNNAASRYLYAFHWLRNPSYQEYKHEFQMVYRAEKRISDLNKKALSLLKTDDTIRAMDSLILGSEKNFCNFCPDVRFYDSDYFVSNVEVSKLVGLSLAYAEYCLSSRRYRDCLKVIRAVIVFGHHLSTNSSGVSFIQGFGIIRDAFKSLLRFKNEKPHWQDEVRAMLKGLPTPLLDPDKALENETLRSKKLVNYFSACSKGAFQRKLLRLCFYDKMLGKEFKKRVMTLPASRFQEFYENWRDLLVSLRDSFNDLPRLGKIKKSMVAFTKKVEKEMFLGPYWPEIYKFYEYKTTIENLLINAKE